MNNLFYENFNDTYRLLPCERLSDHPLRLDFYSQAHLKELEASILCNGLLEPLLVYETSNDKFIILSGHYLFSPLITLDNNLFFLLVVVGE